MEAGGGCDALLDRARPLAWAAISWLITCAAFGALLMALWPSVQVRQEIADAGALAAFMRDAMWPLLPAATVAVCTALARHARKRLAFLVLFTVAAFDLGRIGIRFNPTIPLAEAAPATAGIRYLERAITAGRILPIGVRLLPGNTMLRYGVPAAQGGDWVNIRHYEFLLTGSTGHYDFGREFRSVPETWRALNVTHLVVPAGTSLPPAATLSYDDELRVVPLADAMPRATIVHAAEVVASDAEARALIAQARVDLHQRVLLMREDAPTPQELPSEALTAALRETERVDVTDDGPNSLRVGFHASAPGFLVLTETFLPGWACELDGDVVPILRANIAFRAIRVPPGEHVAVFTYRPQSARYGIALAAGTLGTIAGMAILRRRRARRRC